MPDMSPVLALAKLPDIVVRKAFTLISHLLLRPDAKVAILGSKNVALAYAMATINLRHHYTAIELDARSLKTAPEKFKRSNLRFQKGHMAGLDLGTEQYDAIIAVDFLHEVYSNGQYNIKSVKHTLTEQMAALKEGGKHIIYDFVSPPEEQFVLLEFPENNDDGDETDPLSDAERLIWFSHHARPLHPQGSRGFYLEELSPRFPKTRLFRLSYKWAYEFIIRKDVKNTWKAHLSKEYTFFTDKEYRKALKYRSARLLYKAPQWNNTRIKECFQGRFRLLNEDGDTLPYPATGFITVAEKISGKDAARIRERRQMPNDEAGIAILPMKNEENGHIHEIALRHEHFAEILPYRVTSNGRVQIFLHEHAPKALSNTVKRRGLVLDNRFWSGHLISQIQTPLEDTLDCAQGKHPRETIKFMNKYTGLKPIQAGTLEPGLRTFPAPETIDDRVETFYVEVERAHETPQPQIMPSQTDGYSHKGEVNWFDAQDILRAISVGLVPNARLEIQISQLLEKLNIFVEGTVACERPEIPTCEPAQELVMTEEELEAAVSDEQDNKPNFVRTRGKIGQIKSYRSVFVGESTDEDMDAGVCSNTVDFILSEQDTINRAVIMPLTRDLSGDVLAGFQLEDLPVPDRYGKRSKQLTLPSLMLPEDVTSIEDARTLIAELLDTQPKYVISMGPSFFSHIDMMPQRIYPFAVSGLAGGKKWGKSRYAPVSKLWKICDTDFCDSFLWKLGLVYKMVGPDSDMHTCYMGMDKHSIERSISSPTAGPSSHSSSTSPKKEPQ